MCGVLRTDVKKLFSQPSKLPALDDAVRNGRNKLEFLEGEVLKQLDKYPKHPEEDQFDELRRTLCVAIATTLLTSRGLLDHSCL